MRAKRLAETEYTLLPIEGYGEIAGVELSIKC